MEASSVKRPNTSQLNSPDAKDVPDKHKIVMIHMLQDTVLLDTVSMS
jgi:hypothetical protein